MGSIGHETSLGCTQVPVSSIAAANVGRGSAAFLSAEGNLVILAMGCRFEGTLLISLVYYDVPRFSLDRLGSVTLRA